jgi:hypothetical protein
MKIIIPILLATAVVFFVACTKGGKLNVIEGDKYSVTSIASSKQLVPAIDTTSTGTFTGFYDTETNILTYTLAWNDLWRTTSKDTITSVSFYGPASTTANGTKIRTLPFVNLNNTGSINLGLSGGTGFTETEKSDFLLGAYYFTINTKKYPAGIIRGQLEILKQ